MDERHVVGDPILPLVQRASHQPHKEGQSQVPLTGDQLVTDTHMNLT